MKQEKLKIISNKQLTADVFEMKLYRTIENKNLSDVRAGQFVNILIDGLYLRRPISVCDYNDGLLTLVYKVVGKGTEKMSKMPVGTMVDVLLDLGNGYDLTKSGKKPLLIGGGVGIPPLYLLCKQLVANGAKPTVILGFNTAEEVFYLKEFFDLCSDVTVTTVDGTIGTKGFVTDELKLKQQNEKQYTYFYTCGPEPMLKAIYSAPLLVDVDGEFSFEERMGCGFGACMGCSCKTITGYKRICKEGPVIPKNEICWR